MLLILFIIPIFTLLSAFFLYKHNGKVEFLRFDLVQFVYAFILAPLLFLWLKSFGYYLFSSELGLKISSNELFIMDSLFSVIALYVFAFIVIHSVTKSFELKQRQDPLHDLFAHSEYFHLEFSHFFIYLGAMSILTILSIANIFFPIYLEGDKPLMWLVIGLGLVCGVITYLGIQRFETSSLRFHKLMSLSYGFFFSAHVLAYYFLTVRFSLEYAAFWYSFMIFISLVFLSFFSHQGKTRTFWQQLKFRISSLTRV
jgi:hypothetical protein